MTTECTTRPLGFDPRHRIFPLACVSRPALRPTQPPIQWIPGVLSLGVNSSRGMTLTTHPHLGPRSRMKSYIPLLPSTSMACSGTALLYFRWILRNYSRKLLLPFLQFAFCCYLQQFFRCAFNFHIFIMHCIVYLNFMFPKFQSSRDLHLYNALRGNRFNIKWRLLRDCLYLHVLSHTTITICWSAIQLRQIRTLLYRTKMAFPV
jgi:hypothetical protein